MTARTFPAHQIRNPVLDREGPLPAEEFLRLVAGVRNQHLVKDTPFIKALVKGEVSREGLKVYVKEYYQGIQPMIPNIASVIAMAPDNPDSQRGAFRLMARNFVGEAGYLGFREHYELWKDLGRGLGMTVEEMEGHQPLPTTVAFMGIVGYYCRRTFEEAMGGLGLAAEGQGDHYYGYAVHDALKEHYGLDDDAVAFFKAHMGEEEEHGENALAIVSDLLVTRGQQIRVWKAFANTLLTHEHMYTGFEPLIDL